MKIAETGFWQGNTESFHKFDEPLAKELCKLFKSTAVVDLGCGEGKYVKALNEAGIVASGYDGNHNTELYQNCKVHDLTTPLNILPVNWVLSLEVGEHIPSEHTASYINNLKRLNRNGIVLSWAIPGQGGDGHVNELPNEEVIAMFPEYSYDKKTSERLRKAATLWWFKNTIMVFKK